MREKSFAQGLVVRKMVELGLEARLTQRHQSQLFSYLSPCASGVAYSGSGVCVCVCVICTQCHLEEHDICQTINLRAISVLRFQQSLTIFFEFL